jgi:uncharacterized protein YuzE
MNEAFEVELTQIKTSFLASPVDLIIGVEKQTTLKVDNDGNVQGFTDIEWQVVYCRVLVEERWYFLPQSLYDEIDDEHGDVIGNHLWKLTREA